jgi:hypothetical protein
MCSGCHRSPGSRRTLDGPPVPLAQPGLRADQEPGGPPEPRPKPPRKPEPPAARPRP